MIPEAVRATILPSGEWRYGLAGAASRLLADARDGVVRVDWDAVRWAADNGCGNAAQALRDRWL